MNRLALTGARIFTGDGWLDAHALIMAGGRIEALVPVAELDPRIARRSLNGGVLAPGFIDLQANGGGGFLLNDTPDVATMAATAAAHRRFGTTALLPTFITDHPAKMAQVLAAARDAQRAGVAGVLGLHLEGPFLDVARRGAHPEAFVRTMDDADVAQLLQADCGTLLLTVSPRAVSVALMARLVATGIVLSLGHSDATSEEAGAALGAGARAFTHLFNAMSPLAHRAPGMVGAALASEDAWCGLICDGIHVADTAVNVALKAKGASKIFLISDAMAPAAGGPDAFSLQGRKVTRRDGALRLEDGTLAGCDLTILQAVRHCVKRLGVPLADALRMGSATPAALIGRDFERGYLRAGYCADVVHLDAGLALDHVWVDGIAI